MKSCLFFVAVFALILLVGLEIFGLVLMHTPAPMMKDSLGVYDTPEHALDTYIAARNAKDYLHFLECQGQDTNVDITPKISADMVLWGSINNYSVSNIERHQDMARVTVTQDFVSDGGNSFPGQKVDYYFNNQSGRWIYLPSGMKQTVLWLRASVMGIVFK